MSDTETDRTNLAAALRLIKQACPTAVTAKVETSDQNRYGFELRAVVAADGHELDVPAELEEEVWNLLRNLDWNSRVGEDSHGYAALQLNDA